MSCRPVLCNFLKIFHEVNRHWVLTSCHMGPTQCDFHLGPGGEYILNNSVLSVRSTLGRSDGLCMLPLGAVVFCVLPLCVVDPVSEFTAAGSNPVISRVGT